MVNTRGDHRHDHCADDRPVYSPYNSDIHSPGSVPFAPFAGGDDMRVAAAVLNTHSSSCTAVWCGVCGLGIYYVGQKPQAKLEPLDA